MIDFDSELMIGGTGLQCLVWIQLLVMILLIVLLIFFSIYALEIGDTDVRVSVSTGLGGRDGSEDLSVDRERRFVENRLKVVGSSSIRGEISTAGVTRRVFSRQNGPEGDAASVKDVTINHAASETHIHHLCSFLKFAREAFLKCLGLDCLADDSTKRKQRKSD